MTYPIGYRGHCFLAIVNGKLMQFASDTEYYEYITDYLVVFLVLMDMDHEKKLKKNMNY